MIIKKYMENRELIYEMAKRLDMVIEVTKEGKYIGKYKFINNKLHKLNEPGNTTNNNKEVRNMQGGKTNS
jgi:hypothetical protein